MAQQVKVKLGFISWEPQKGLVPQEWGWGGGGTHKWQNHSISISFFVALLLEGLSKGLSNGANKDKEEKEEDAGNSAEDHSHTEVGLVEAEQLPENLMLQTNNPVDIPIMRRALSNVIRAVCQNPKKKRKLSPIKIYWDRRDWRYQLRVSNELKHWRGFKVSVRSLRLVRGAVKNVLADFAR